MKFVSFNKEVMDKIEIYRQKVIKVEQGMHYQRNFE